MRLAHVLFFLSGFSALVYETVWTRRLILLFGATIHSASAVLAAFMTGFALGSALGAVLVRRSRQPLRLYGYLELGIAAWAAVFPLVLGAYPVLAETGALSPRVLGLVLTFVSVLPAAVLMGATFPVLSRLAQGTDSGQKVSGLYAANLAGACLGVLGAAFLLLPLLGLSGSHGLAAVVNAAAGLIALRARGPDFPSDSSRSTSDIPGRLAVAALASGMIAMALEVVWIRILSPSFNNSAYGFSAVLFVFLFGMGLGSAAVSRGPQPTVWSMGLAQALSGLFAFVGYRLYEVTQLLQIHFDALASSTISPVVAAPLGEALIVLLPAAFLQGMVLPAALRMAAERGGADQAAGKLCLWNTVGGIAGSLLAGFWLVPAFSAHGALMIVIGVGAVFGGLLAAGAAGTFTLKAAALGTMAAACIAAVLGYGGASMPKKTLLDWLNRRPIELARLVFYADDLEASVAVPQRFGKRHLIINGVGVTGYTNATKMMAHIPLSLHTRPERVLVICFGMGTTFRSALRHPVRVEAVDLTPSVFKTFPLFYPDAERWLKDPRAMTLVNDGRNHLLRDREGYDVIIADPSPPLYAAGTVNLYSRDFFALALKRLRPGGLLAVWLLETPETEFKMVMKSFLSAAPFSQVWRAMPSGEGVILLGSNDEIPLDRKRARSRLRSAGVYEDMLEFNRDLESEESFWKLYLGPAERFSGYLEGVSEVTDDFPRIEYPYFRSKTPPYQEHPAVLKWPPVAVP